MLLKTTCKLLYMPRYSVNTKGKIIHHKIQGKPWEVLGADMFTLNNTNYLCILDYHSIFPAVKKTEDLSADSVTLTCKVIFSEYGLPRKIMSDAGSKFVSDKFKQFCKNLNIIIPSHSNEQVEAYIKFIKCTIKNAPIINQTYT